MEEYDHDPFHAKALCKHLYEKRGTTNHDYTFKNWPVFSSAAPCAPVINPQAPNAATGTSLRVCWGLFSDDTVECYQLCYQPVSNERHSDGPAGKEAWGKGTPQPSTGKTSWCQSASACPVHSVCHQNCPICHHHLLCPSSPARSAMLPTAAGPSQELRQDTAAAGIAGMGRGQWMESQGFLEGGHCIRTCAASMAHYF